MAKFVIERIKDGERAWSWCYEDGLTLEIKKEAYIKNEILDILKGLKNQPTYEVDKEGKVAIFFVADGSQQLAKWDMENNPIEKILNEFKNAEIAYRNPEDDPSNIEKNMQENVGTGESGS